MGRAQRHPAYHGDPTVSRTLFTKMERNCDAVGRESNWRRASAFSSGRLEAQAIRTTVFCLKFEDGR